MPQRRLTPGRERREPTLQVAGLAQERQGHRVVVAELAHPQPPVLHPFDGGAPQVDHPERPADLLLGVEDGEVLQRGAVDDHVHALPTAVRRHQGDAAALRFGGERLLLLVGGEALADVHCHLGWHLGAVH